MARCGLEDALAEAFEQQRGRLVAMAYRMLGSRADSEDAVQEAWLRLARADASTIDNLAGWLTRVVGRVCLDVLRARKIRPESSFDEAVSELVTTEDQGGGPEDDILLADSIGSGLVVVLDHLSPAERLAFVLHDVFAVPFQRVGELIGRSADATKMVASRARRKLRCSQPPVDAGRQQREVVDAFFAAAHSGDFDGLLRVLDPNVTLPVHAARGTMVDRRTTAVRAGRTSVPCAVPLLGKAV